MKRWDFPEEALGRLVKFLHTKPGSKNLAAEFGDFWLREAALNHLPIVSTLTGRRKKIFGRI